MFATTLMDAPRTPFAVLEPSSQMPVLLGDKGRKQGLETAR
jgi:hypothetical protein